MRNPVLRPTTARVARVCFIAALVTLLLVDLSGQAEAARKRRRSSRSRNGAAAAKAAKQRAISSIQKQVAAAQKVLAAAESKASMSQSELSRAVAELNNIRDDVDSSQLDAREAAEILRELESEILSEQPKDSEWAQAQVALAEARDALHDVIHRLVQLPPDDGTGAGASERHFAKLSSAGRERLESDPDYRRVHEAFQKVSREVTQLRDKVLAADSEWVSARQDLADAAKAARESNQQAKSAALSALGDSRDLRKSQDVAAMARSIIAQGEARLRQLGAKASTSSSKSK